VLVPFIGYSTGRRFIGYVECMGEQMADLLNRSESLVIREAFVESFDDDTITNLGDGELARSDLYAVETNVDRGARPRHAPGPRQRLQIQLGPYTALGVLQDGSGQMQLPWAHGDGPMLPLSDATLGYWTHGQTKLRDVGTLIVNRDLLDWVRASEGDARAFPGVPVLTDRT
jgi:hypothetical protein